MSIKGPVGRYTQLGGRNCNNSIEDQKTVIALLNRVSVANGGADGSLNPPIKNGMAGDALYAAIVKFEAKQTPGHRNGFIEWISRQMAPLCPIGGDD